VYTRKSSEEGLEQAFNSLDAQREAGLDYIKSQKHQGWAAVPSHYDDGGYSGGSMDRPALQRLLADIQSRRIDVVVVYKVDRLSRSLADFARLMQTFDEHQVSFVSVTQQFNTTSSMGRLTLNMLLSFAQFEREVTGERIRDKIAATKRRGIWVGGVPPIGYRLPRGGDEGHISGDRTLKVVEHEAAIVRFIFKGYVETGSLVALAKRLHDVGHTTKRWRSAHGKPHGGRRLTTSQVYRILTNPIYLGKITHTRVGKTEVYDAEHTPIVPRTLWDEVHTRMERIERETRHRWTHTHLLKGKIRTCEDFAMSPGSVQKVAKRNDASVGSKAIGYYTSQKALKQGYASCPVKSINAGYLDDLVRAIVMDHVMKATSVNLRSLANDQRDHWIRQVIERVVLAPDLLAVEIKPEEVKRVAKESDVPGTSAGLRARDRKCRGGRANQVATAGSDIPACPFQVQVDDSGSRTKLLVGIQLKRVDGRRVIVSPSGDDLTLKFRADASPAARQYIIRAVGRAFAWHHEMFRHGTRAVDIARRVKLTKSRIGQLLALTQLCPGLLAQIFRSELSPNVSLDDLLCAAKHLNWDEQQRMLKLACGPLANPIQ
jgi:DNA invertase Pin-like site-specific DNA recombinase